MTVNITPRDQRVLEARAIAKTVTEFARILGICNKTVQHYYKRYNIEPFPHGGHQRHPRADEVCTLFQAGKSMGEIGIALGMTRGSVAGIIHRAGLFQKRAPRAPKPFKAKTSNTNRLIKKPKIRATPFRERVPPAPFLGVSLMDRERGQCAFPAVKDFDPRNPLYCGQPTSSGPYCPACASIMYQPMQARHREPRPRA